MGEKKAADIVARLNDACVGHPEARIPWPHRLIHDARDEIERLRMVVEWYGENARLARLNHSEGDKGRHALSNDGGNLAREALGK